MSFLLFLCPAVTWSQNPGNKAGILFYHLNTSQGLSDNYIFDMCTDMGGNLWIASGEGLNMFNGKTVTRFFKEEYPQLTTDYTRQLICDEQNRIWVMNQGGFMTMIDENRKFHRVALYRNGVMVPVRRILKTESLGIVLLAGHDFLSVSGTNDYSTIDSLTTKHFSALPIIGFDSSYASEFSQATTLGKDKYIISTTTRFIKINFKTRHVEKEYNFPDLVILTGWKTEELLVYDKANPGTFSIDLTTGTRKSSFDSIRDQHGDLYTAISSRALLIEKDQLWITTNNNGLFLYNIATGKLYNFKHNAADPTTIVNNSPSAITSDQSGWIFTGNTPNGISYFKNNAVIGQQLIFTNTKGTGYDGYINTIATLDNDNYYIGISDNLLKWKRSTNTTQFLATYQNDKSALTRQGVNYVAFDSKNRLWVAIPSIGIYILDENNRVAGRLRYDSILPGYLPSNFVRHMGMDPQKKFMWLSTRAGLCRVDIATLAIDRLEKLPFAALTKSICNRTWFYDADNLWIASEKLGAWHYTFSTGQMRQYTVANGMPDNTIFCFNKDNFNNIYIGTMEGLLILLTNGKTKIVTRKDGLLHNRIEALLLDKKNRIWMGNDVGLSCFMIADSSLRIFDERFGLSVQGFRINSYHQNSDDELVWGTERGLQYFYPDNLIKQKISLNTSIHRVETRDVEANLTQNAVFLLSPNDNYVTFYFSAIDYSKHLRTFYEYKLEGLDENWIRVIDQNFVRYNSLQAGNYLFKVRASNDGKVWEEAKNTVTITIAKPVWQQTWFKMLGALIGLLLIWFVVRYYRLKQIRQREELETEVVINYFASQINSHKNTNELLWDIAKNCISKLHFEDCVIYLKDETRNILIQKAAYGPKNPIDFTIHQPMEIPVGKGIVGTVAVTGKAELISNTATDSRYLVDDATRLSEITVPVIIDGKVVGVIDSEHSRKNFFSSRHLQVLSTVAALCATQIQRTNAEEEKQKAKIELLENKQKAAESRLQSLRLQMNPHFLFNALNSIQQMILANEDIVATKYLSRFSKLLRAILVHSDKESITLKEELEILNLYIELESIRFKDSFSYTVQVDEEIETEEVRIPTLLVQPFVENAIWHGLMHKEGEKILKVKFIEEGDFIKCTIEDNGVGRTKTAAMKLSTGQDKKHVSKGIAVSNERLKALCTRDGREGTITIIDLADSNGIPGGTRVEINFPIQN